jgi:hypothetical protein
MQDPQQRQQQEEDYRNFFRNHLGSFHLAVDRDHSLQLLPTIEAVLVDKLLGGTPAGLIKPQELELV